jgi:hypothetical protein
MKLYHRNVFFLRVGKNYVLPCVLILPDPAACTDIIFQVPFRMVEKKKSSVHFWQHLLSSIRDIILRNMTKNGGLDLEKLVSQEKGEIFRVSGLEFLYSFAPTSPKYCLLRDKVSIHRRICSIRIIDNVSLDSRRIQPHS